MTSSAANLYRMPQHWIRYDLAAIAGPLVEARTAAAALKRLPHLQSWIEEAHETQLRLEAAGTSRIEGAEFTQEQQEAVFAPGADGAAFTHSQRQLAAANRAYRWIRALPADRPVTADLVRHIHRLIVTGCDDDHCEPGALRRGNVTFGVPRCRGAEGGEECAAAFGGLIDAVSGEYRRHDRIVQAMAAHYHVGAMHPFDDGNGRTARALEAFMLRSAGVNDMVMVSLSNYYYERQSEYLASLYESRARGHDLTPFLQFALPAVAERCNALADDIASGLKRLLFREFAQSLFGRLRSPRRRVLAERQMQILNVLLDSGPMPVEDLVDRTGHHYHDLRHPDRAMIRDAVMLFDMSAVRYEDGLASVNLDWPQQSQSELLARYERMPTAASAKHPAMAELTRLIARR